MSADRAEDRTDSANALRAEHRERGLCRKLDEHLRRLATDRAICCLDGRPHVTDVVLNRRESPLRGQFPLIVRPRSGGLLPGVTTAGLLVGVNDLHPSI